MSVARCRTTSADFAACRKRSQGNQTTNLLFSDHENVFELVGGLYRCRCVWRCRGSNGDDGTVPGAFRHSNLREGDSVTEFKSTYFVFDNSVQPFPGFIKRPVEKWNGFNVAYFNFEQWQGILKFFEGLEETHSELHSELKEQKPQTSGLYCLGAGFCISEVVSMEKIATYFVGDLFEMMDDENRIVFNSVVCPNLKNNSIEVFVSDDADEILLYQRSNGDTSAGYIERLHGGKYFLMLENQGFISDDLQALEQKLFAWV